MPPETKSISQSLLIDDNQKHLQTVAYRTYCDQKNDPVKNEQITELLPMVPKIVQRIVSYLKPPLSYEDLISAGTVGLVKAAKDFNPKYQADFKTYAYIRIRGAILDELRGWSFVSVNVNKQIQKALQLSTKITEQTGSAPSDEELAEKLDISIEKLYQTFENARAQQFVSIDRPDNENSPALSNLLPAANSSDPTKKIEKNELIDKLAEAIRKLEKKQKQIILLYYQQQLTMKQIAEVFNITEPRVSQLHASALFNLSLKLRQFDDSR